MKNLIGIFILILGIGFTSFGQKFYSSYKGGEIGIVVKGIENGFVYLDVKHDGSIGLILDKNSRDKFKKFINDSYIKMSKTGVEYSKLNSDIDVEMSSIDMIDFDAYFKYGSDWKFGTIELITYMKIDKGDVIFMLYTSEIIASDEPYMVSEHTLNQYTRIQLDGLLKSLSEDSIKIFIEKEKY